MLSCADMAPSEDAPPPSEGTAATGEDLLTSLNEWLAVLEGVLAREINPEHREELERGTAELKGIVQGLMNDQAARRQP